MTAPSPLGGSGWRDRAACRGRTRLFFSMDPKKIATARAICESCPVAAECREASPKEQHGVWGGADRNVRYEVSRTRDLRFCEWCGDEYLALHTRQRFCCRQCSGKASVVASRRPSVGVPLPHGWDHGTRKAYTKAACRCDECRAAEAAYHRERRRRLRLVSA